MQFWIDWNCLDIEKYAITLKYLPFVAGKTAFLRRVTLVHPLRCTTGNI